MASAAGWKNLVDHALAESVDVVLLAGDVIHRFNRSFEAWGPLDEGLARLAEAGIHAVAVAGNHDFDTLPDVADEVADGHLRVLGVGGEWERWTLSDGDGRPLLHVDGWSFPREHHASDPTQHYSCERAEAPVIGLLHCDLDQKASSYGPVRSATLRGHGADVWVLGHIHVPSLHDRTGSAPLLYPGSLQALHPGESEFHGAWMLEVGPGGAPAFERIPLSSVHYATVEVEVDGCKEPGDVAARARSALSQHLANLAGEGGGHLRAAWCRVRLTGSTALHDRMEEILSGVEDFSGGPGQVRLKVDSRMDLDTRPALDLEERASRSDPSGHLARLLLALDAESDDSAASEHTVDSQLLEKASRAARHVSNRSHYAGQGLEDLETGSGSPVVRKALRRQAGRLLDAMVADKEDE